MAEVTRTKYVTKGGWKTLEWSWNASFKVRFLLPKGATVKVRYGVGFLGWDSQKTTLNGETPVLLSVGGASVTRARVQISVQQDTDVRYVYIAA